LAFKFVVFVMMHIVFRMKFGHAGWNEMLMLLWSDPHACW